ncbi:unnamed protein product, partial [Mesorhabditis belari]|uniref:Uncharacterized protein n=1 Tax=Mesorhabditis belari TaxID=2138241 RepID=A0AAF3EX67_9BILA
MIILALLILCYSPRPLMTRLLEPGNSKIDAHLVESVLSDVVEHSMSDLTEKLRTALRHILFPDEQLHARRQITQEEEQLVATFINQLMEQRHLSAPNIQRFSTRVNSNPIRVVEQLKATQLSDDPLELSKSKENPTKNPREEKRNGDQNGLLNSIHLPIDPPRFSPKSQKISVALETVTTKTPTKIITVDELRFADEALHDDDTPEPPSLFLSASRLPIWICVFLSISLVFASTACGVAVIRLWRSKRRENKMRARSLHRFPDPLTISGFTCVPGCDNGPGTFLERMKVMNRVNRAPSTCREREDETIWRTANSLRSRQI